MKHIIIIGGGISGLTAAHELVEQGYKVTILERNSQVGGLARTYQKENVTCPYEYSWRAYGKWYHNVYDIMKRIPFEKGTVFDKLIILQEGKKTCSKKIPSYQNPFDKIPYSDYFTLFTIFIFYYLSCKERNISNYSGIGLRKKIHELKLSTATENVAGKIVGPYLGFDYHNASLYDLLHAVEMMDNNSETNNFNISSLPTSFVWFDPWLKMLRKKGVTIHENVEVVKLNIKESSIQSITIKDKDHSILTADYYINCTGPEVLEKLISPYQQQMYPFYEKIKNVSENGRQIQLSIYYYINKKIFLENENTLAYLPNTPWLLMILPTGHIWGDDYMSHYCSPDIKEIVSIGICEPYVEGIFIKKKWSECTREEIQIEAWYQMIHDEDFKNNICIQGKLEDITILDFKMWDSFVYTDGKIDTYEPKWANNINTVQYRPTTTTPISNLFLAGSYSNTSTGIYSMESATESGKLVAKQVCKIDQRAETIYLHTKKTFFFSFFRWFDFLIYHYSLVILYLIICFLVKKFKLGTLF